MPRPPDSIRLVPLTPDPEEVHALELEQGWKPTDKFSPELPQWTLPDADAKVSWVEDPDTEVDYFVIEGADRKQAAKQIEDAIRIMEPDDFEPFLERSADAGIQQFMRDIQAVALAAPENHHAGTRKL